MIRMNENFGHVMLFFQTLGYIRNNVILIKFIELIVKHIKFV